MRTSACKGWHKGHLSKEYPKDQQNLQAILSFNQVPFKNQGASLYKSNYPNLDLPRNLCTLSYLDLREYLGLLEGYWVL